MRKRKWIECTTQAEVDAVPAGDFAVVRQGRYVARESSHVEARESSHVEARESSHVVAWGSSHVVARGSSHVVARESSHVEARESSHVVASPFVAVHRRSSAANVTGQGVVIIPPDFNGRTKADPAEWCAYHGVPIDNGVAVLYKAVDDNFKSGHGMEYIPGSTPKAPDWRPTKACGNGLHLVPHPTGGLFYFPEATKFVACPVLVAELVVIDESKVKAPSVADPGCSEVDRYGKPVAPEPAPKKATRKRKAKVSA